MNRAYVWIPTMLFVCVSLAACDRGDEPTNSRSNPDTHADAAYSDTFDLIAGEGAGSYVSDAVASGTCGGESELFAECEAPLAEPASPTDWAAIAPESICAATRDRVWSPVIADAGGAHKPTMVSAESALVASTSARRCGEANASRGTIPESARTAQEEITSCSCGMKLCLCG